MMVEEVVEVPQALPVTVKMVELAIIQTLEVEVEVLAVLLLQQDPLMAVLVDKVQMVQGKEVPAVAMRQQEPVVEVVVTRVELAVQEQCTTHGCKQATQQMLVQEEALVQAIELRMELTVQFTELEALVLGKMLARAAQELTA
jgi:hypothetical protein